jgi:hypothetical protein
MSRSEQVLRILRQRRLTEAAKRNDTAALQELIIPADQRSHSDENELRIVLQRASEAGSEAVETVYLPFTELSREIICVLLRPSSSMAQTSKLKIDLEEA